MQEAIAAADNAHFAASKAIDAMENARYVALHPSRVGISRAERAKWDALTSSAHATFEAAHELRMALRAHCKTADPLANTKDIFANA